MRRKAFLVSLSLHRTHTKLPYTFTPPHGVIVATILLECFAFLNSHR